MSNNIIGGVAVVTGASTGIGEATALRLARDGHHVIAAMRRPADSGLMEIANAESLRLETATLDVDSDESVTSLFAEVFAELGRVDVLVANAGVGGGGGPMETATIDHFRSTMETNFFGALRCIHEVLPSMRERGQGSSSVCRVRLVVSLRRRCPRTSRRSGHWRAPSNRSLRRLPRPGSGSRSSSRDSS